MKASSSSLLSVDREKSILMNGEVEVKIRVRVRGEAGTDRTERSKLLSIHFEWTGWYSKSHLSNLTLIVKPAAYTKVTVRDQVTPNPNSDPNPKLGIMCLNSSLITLTLSLVNPHNPDPTIPVPARSTHYHLLRYGRWRPLVVYVLEQMKPRCKARRQERARPVPSTPVGRILDMRNNPAMSFLRLTGARSQGKV